MKIPITCPRHNVILAGIDTVHGRSIRRCPYGGCDIYQYVKNGYPESLPADRETRWLRTRCHLVLDSLWKNPDTRRKIYHYLADKMNLPYNDCHIAFFDKEACLSATAILQQYKEWVLCAAK